MQRTDRSSKGFSIFWLAATGLAVLLAGGAQAFTIDPSASGLDQGQGCGDPVCAFNVIYELDASAPVSGTLDITGSTISFSINLASASFSGSDGAVSSVAFSNVTYSGSFGMTLDGLGGSTISDQTSAISGTLTPDVGVATLFSAVDVNTIGGCTGLGTASPTCWLQFGPTSDFDALVNGDTRYFRHTVDVSVVPEPGTALLLGMGLAALGARRRS